MVVQEEQNIGTFFLFNIIAAIILSTLDNIIFIRNELLVINGMIVNIFILSPVYALITLIPGLAVAVRRMHDVGKSGWFLLIPIYNIVLLCSEGTTGDNKFWSLVTLAKNHPTGDGFLLSEKMQEKFNISSGIC